MKTKINFEVALVSVATLFLLLSANTSFARDSHDDVQHTVYKSEALHAPSNFHKVASSRYYGNRYYGYRSNRNYYRGNRYYHSNRYYRGGRSYYRGNRFNRFNRFGHRSRFGH